VQDRLSHGADLMLRIQGSTELPVHRIMLSASCAVVLTRALDSLPRVGHFRQTSHSAGPGSGARAARRFRVAGWPPSTGVHAFPVLVLLHYLYTDTPLATAIRGLPVSLRTHLQTAGYNPPKPCANYKLSGSRGLRLEGLDALCSAVAQRVPPPLLNAHF
jgi:hypothetical protein